LFDAATDAGSSADSGIEIDDTPAPDDRKGDPERPLASEAEADVEGDERSRRGELAFGCIVDVQLHRYREPVLERSAYGSRRVSRHRTGTTALEPLEARRRTQAVRSRFLTPARLRRTVSE
jgi:hypothetical protein